MGEYTPITLQRGINDVTYMDNNGRITDVDWNVPIYFLRGNTYENIGTINDIRGRKNFNGITDANSILIGSIDDFISGRLRGKLFIKNYEEEKRTPSKLRGGKMKGRKTSNKKSKSRKQRKTKRRITKKNKIRPIIYGGASIKQYGIATALRTLIFTYFPQRGFDIISLSEPTSLDKYGLTNRYTTVMDLLNQIVHNDDGRSILPREDKFGDFLTYSQDLDNVLSDIISDIKQYFYQPKISNRISPKEINEISRLINSIQDELVRTTGLSSEKELPESASASAQGVIPGRTRIPVASIFSKASSDDRQTKYPLMCEYLRNEFPTNTNKASGIAFNFFDNLPMRKEDLEELLDLFKQSQEAGYIGPEYKNEIIELQKEIENI